MTREEFKKLFPVPDDIEQKEGDTVVYYLRIETRYNKAIEAFRPSLESAPPCYADKVRSFLTERGHRTFSEMLENGETIKLKQAIESDPFVKFLADNNVPFEADVEVHPSTVTVFGEPHHFASFLKIKAPIQWLYLYYGQNYKRKIFFFVENGVLTVKTPPYNLEDSIKDIGITPRGNILEIVGTPGIFREIFSNNREETRSNLSVRRPLR